MNKFSIFLAVTLLLVPYIVFADISCQYNDIGTYNETEQFLVDNSNNIQGKPPKFSDFITEKNNITSFIINNPNPFKILVHLNFTIEGFGGGGKYNRYDVKPLQNRKVEELCNDNNKIGYCFINESSITYFVSTPDSPDLSILYPKNLTLTKTKLVCKLCNNTICLDDGTECSINAECGGGFCVEKICNNKPECFVDNCKCERFDKIQCKDNRCVSKNILPEGARPCDSLECITNYTDDGRCAKSPAQIKEEAEKEARDKSIRNIILLVLSIIIIISIIILVIYNSEKNRKKREQKARRRVREAAEKEYEEAKKEQERARNEYLKKTNLLIQNIRVQEDALADKKRQLSESKNVLAEAEKNLEKTKQIKKEIESETTDIAEMEREFSEMKSKEKEWTKPYTSLTRGFMEWRNPNISNKYYPCYWNGPGKNNNIEIHKDLAKNEIFDFYKHWFKKNYSGKMFDDLIVHHIDKDIFNYNLGNLVIISKEQHKKLDPNINSISHKKIQHQNWESGIKELLRNNISAPHIDELGGNSITDAHEILGISKGATPDEIKKAWRELVVLNHPDNVASLDKQFQILAEKRTKKINEAYQKLVDKI